MIYFLRRLFTQSDPDRQSGADWQWLAMYGLQVVVVVLVALGFVPREIVLALGVAMAYFLLRASLRTGFLFFVVSTPFFVALPLSPEFDSLNMWRIAALLLFAKLLWEQVRHYGHIRHPWGASVRIMRDMWVYITRTATTRAVVIAGALIAALTVTGIALSTDVFAGVKRLIYIVNALLMLPVAVSVLRDKSARKSFFFSVVISFVTALIIGYAQLALAYFITDGAFWTYWGSLWSHTFYGDAVSRIVLQANTWFSYYATQPPTIRLFGTFTDSHAFGLYVILGMVPFLAQILQNKPNQQNTDGRRRWQSWTFIALALFAVILSGTRGLWVSITGPLVLLALFYFFNILKKEKHIAQVIKIIGLFVILLPLSSIFLIFPQFQYDSDLDGLKTFRRFGTVADLDETSNKGRIEIWQASVRSVIEKPFLGVGLGNFPVVLDQETRLSKAGSSAHNLYLHIATEQGIVVLTGVLLILIALLIALARGIMHNKRYDALYIAITFSFAWALAYSVFDIALLDARVLLLLIALIGLVIAQINE